MAKEGEKVKEDKECTDSASEAFYIAVDGAGSMCELQRFEVQEWRINSEGRRSSSLSSPESQRVDLKPSPTPSTIASLFTTSSAPPAKLTWA